jgi:NhaP-type Na+/H+ or K+/H+ antiporter
VASGESRSQDEQAASDSIVHKVDRVSAAACRLSLSFCVEIGIPTATGHRQGFRGACADGDRLWSVVALVVIGSIVIHGITATPAIVFLDKGRHREAVVDGDGESNPQTTAV